MSKIVKVNFRVFHKRIMDYLTKTLHPYFPVFIGSGKNTCFPSLECFNFKTLYLQNISIPKFVLNLRMFLEINVHTL